VEQRLSETADASATLGRSGPIVCLPFAGGSAAVVAGWLARAAPELEPVGHEYPGHGRRMAEPFAETVADLVADLAPRVRGAGELRLFGHSLGAVVAFELGLALRAAGESVAGLVVAGCSSPDSWIPQPSVELSDEALIAFVSAGGGGTELLETEELRELFLPMLRADMGIAARYRARFGQRADFPLLALCGAHDPIAPRGAMHGWERLTSEFAGVVSIEGGHFFPRERPAEVAAVLADFFSPGTRTNDLDA
jgi:medium-chain acyl-[acyl-carrier-protein] hydrolase